MQFAIGPDGTRITPAPKARATCPGCGAAVIAKCGQIISWHWSHLTKDCDPWYEPESVWHRQWKEHFPEDWREVVIGKHRADVKTPRGVVEFQASSISSVDVEERENFYGKMIWIVKADSFNLERKFSSYARSYLSKLKDPYPTHQIEEKIARMYGSLAINRPEDSYRDIARLRSSAEYWKIMDELDERREAWSIRNETAMEGAWLKDPMYRWLWPRTTWKFAKKKIYLDLGEDKLFDIKWMSNDCKMIKGSFCNKKEFIRKLLAGNIARGPSISAQIEARRRPVTRFLNK